MDGTLGVEGAGCEQKDRADRISLVLAIYCWLLLTRKYTDSSSLERLGQGGLKFEFLSPLAVMLDVAGAVGYVSNYLVYQTFVTLLPSSLARTHRALAAAVLASMVLTLPLKYGLVKFAAHLVGFGHYLTPSRFVRLFLVSTLTSPLLVSLPPPSLSSHTRCLASALPPPFSLALFSVVVKNAHTHVDARIAGSDMRRGAAWQYSGAALK